MDARRAEALDLGERQSARLRRWTINGDFVALSPYGVARHARETTLALDALLDAADPQTEGLSLDLVAPRADDLGLRRIATRVVEEFATPRLPQVWAQLQLPPHVRGGLLSFCNLAPVSARPHLVCIHDMQTRLVPDSYGAGFRLAHRVILPLLGRRCARIATVTQQARSDIARCGVAPPQRVVVVGNGVDHVRRWRPQASRLTLPEEPFALCLARRERHKNIAVAVEVAQALSQDGATTLFVGDFDESDLAALGRGRPKLLRLMGRLGDDDLALLFSRAAALLVPSRAEGFGLPALEAMAFGCPTIVADIPSLREVCAEGALHAGCDDAAGWIAQARALVADAELRAALAQAGRRRAAHFTWEKVARRYLAVMAQIDAAD